MTNQNRGFRTNDASKALIALARQEQYSTKRDRGFAKWVGWQPTSDGGAIANYGDGTCHFFSAEDIADAQD